MKTKRTLLRAVVALTLLPFGAFAADQSPAPSSPPSSSPSDLRNPTNPFSPSAAQDKDAADINRFSGKITAMDKESKMLTVDDKNLGSHKLHVDESTKLNKSGSEAAKFDELKIGDEVQGTCKKMGDMFHAQTLRVNPGTGEAK